MDKISFTSFKPLLNLYMWESKILTLFFLKYIYSRKILLTLHCSCEILEDTLHNFLFPRGPGAASPQFPYQNVTSWDFQGNFTEAVNPANSAVWWTSGVYKLSGFQGSFLTGLKGSLHGESTGGAVSLKNQGRARDNYPPYWRNTLWDMLGKQPVHSDSELRVKKRRDTMSLE